MTGLGYCRLCAEIKNAATLIVINKNENDSATSLHNKILQCFQIQILSDDVLPKTLCLDCCTQTNVTYEFYLKVQKAQEFLRNIICNSDSDFANNSVQLVKNNELTNENIFQNNVTTDSQNRSKLSPVEIAEFPDYDNSPSLTYNENTEVPETKQTLDDENGANNQIKLEECKEEESEMKLSKKLVWNDFIWNCTKCSSEFKTSKELEEHSQNEHEESPEYKCSKCSKVYRKCSLFRQHIRAHRNISQNRYRCDICSKAFYNNNNLKRHLTNYHKQGPQFKKSCNICGKEFTTLNGFSNHTKYFHKTLEDKLRFECDICKKRVTTRSSLLEHKKIHDDSTKFNICDRCGVGFRSNYALKYHIEHVHTQIKEDNYLSCSLCPGKFKHRSYLGQHIRRVHSHKRFECETCGKKFYVLASYREHLRKHTGERPFECQHCNKRFRLKKDLENHIRQHTGEKPYCCTDCNHEFTDFSNYIKHMKRKHGVTNFKNLRKPKVNTNFKF